MRNKKGYTLVELLAVVIILALFALMIVPATTSIIRSARKNALKDSAYGLIESAKNYYAIQGNEIEYTLFEFKDGEQKTGPTLKYKGSIQGDGVMAITEKGQVAICIASGKYYASKKVNEKEVTVTKASGEVVCTLPEDTGEDFEITISSEKVTNNNKSDCESNIIPESEKYKEDILNGAYPELYQGMIPVDISKSGVVTVANIKGEWYSYKDHRWANAVVINYNDKQTAKKYFNGDMTIKKDVIGKEIQDDDILQYYVWIPRYKYKLWNADNGLSNMQNIEIKFEDNRVAPSHGDKNGEWLTHPAFTFGETELNGIWVGKYEITSWPSTTSKLTIRPYYSSARSIIASTAFEHVRGMDTNYSYLYGFNPSEMDSHLMKNIEWGAMAYLTYSRYGRYDYTEDGEALATTCSAGGDCRVWINCNSSYYTGCSCATVSAGGGGTCNKWNTALGVHASTTDNTSGIYDTSGGAYDFVMGAQLNLNEVFYAQSTGFLVMPDPKYIDVYAYSESQWHHAKGKLGDATREVLTKYDNGTGSWGSGYSYSVYSGAFWYIRGGLYSWTTSANITTFYYTGGGSDSNMGYRAVITRE